MMIRMDPDDEIGIEDELLEEAGFDVEADDPNEFELADHSWASGHRKSHGWGRGTNVW